MIKFYRKALIATTLLLMLCNYSFAAKTKYSCTSLKTELQKNANAVIRDWDIEFTVSDKGHASSKEHFAITILNKNADDLAIFHQSYSTKLSKIKNYKGIIYDNNGKIIKKLSNSDFIDAGDLDYGTLFSDHRNILYRPLINSYPYTVEYEWEEKNDGLLFYPSWIPQFQEDIAIENSSFKISIPNNLTLRYKEINVKDSLSINKTELATLYTWKASNLMALDDEPYSKGYEETSPQVYTAPSNFEIEGFEGNMDSWKEFGLFITKLNEQTNILSDKTKNELKIIEGSTTNKTELVKKVYEYMQSKTRYVSIQVGIGGWKPFDASVVDKYGYGDCKALSNYTKALLKEVGIESLYTLAKAGGTDIHTDFPSGHFNHAILCVPVDNDTIWLECTSQVTPCGYMGRMTHNKHVLLITPEGGKLAFIPEIKQNQSLLVRKANVDLSDISKANTVINTTYTGIQYEEKLYMNYLNSDEQKKHLYKDIELANFDLLNWKYEIVENNPEIKENLTLEVNNYVSVSGKRVFLPLNLMNKQTYVPKVIKDRKTNIYINSPFIDNDTITYKLPTDYKPEFIPQKKEIISKYGKYSEEVVVDGQTVCYIRQMSFNSGLYPASGYNDFVDFFTKVMNADNIKLSLIKTAN